MVLFDQAGERLVLKRIQGTDDITSISDIFQANQMQLVKKERDSKSVFERALESAQRTDRDVWVSFVSIRNPASIALLRWQEENRAELKKHFVLLRMDWQRDENADAMADRFGIANKEENRLVCVLVNKEGRLLHDTMGETKYKEMESSRFIDRKRIGALLYATSKWIDPGKIMGWVESM